MTNCDNRVIFQFSDQDVFMDIKTKQMSKTHLHGKTSAFFKRSRIDFK